MPQPWYTSPDWYAGYHYGRLGPMKQPMVISVYLRARDPGVAWRSISAQYPEARACVRARHVPKDAIGRKTVKELNAKRS
jgi:hypothetical protein